MVLVPPVPRQRSREPVGREFMVRSARAEDRHGSVHGVRWEGVVTDTATTARAWHFTSSTLRDGRPVPPAGEWLEHTGPLALCESGLHASERLLDALQYAPGLTLHRVTLDGETLRDNDKFCARRRRIDATREVQLRALVRLALESACLAAWCAGLYLPDLLTALEASDRGGWQECESSARAAYYASHAASRASHAASGASAAGASAAACTCASAASARRPAADAAADAAHYASHAASFAAYAATYAASAVDYAAARDAARDALESRAVALLWEGA